MKDVKAKKFRSKKRLEHTSNAVGYVILVIISIIWVIPYIYLILQSFRGEPGAYTTYLIPKQLTFDNYVKLFTDRSLFNFPLWYINTLITAIVVCVVQTVIVLATSFALSRLRFKGRKGLMNLMLVLGMFPGFMSMTAIYFVLKEVGLTQSLVGLIIVYVASSALQYYICKGFFDTIPKSLDEAAKIDGASVHTIFFKVILPLSKPIIVYTMLVAFLMPWGEYMFSSLFMLGDQTKFNVANGLRQMLQRENIAEYFTRFCAGP